MKRKVLSKAPIRPWPRRSNSLLLSHALAFAVGVLISNLINREDCGDVALRAIEHHSAPSPPSTASFLREQSLQEGSKKLVTNDDPSTATRELDFYELAGKTATDKVQGKDNLPKCLLDNDPSPSPSPSCPHKDMAREQCRVYGHFYHTLYQQKLGPYYSKEDAEPFQFLEVGFYQGRGYDAFRQFLPSGECHSIEISCLEPGPQEEGKWVRFFQT